MFPSSSILVPFRTHRQSRTIAAEHKLADIDTKADRRYKCISRYGYGIIIVIVIIRYILILLLGSTRFSLNSLSKTIFTVTTL